MINEAVLGAAARVRACFPGLPVYTELQEQGLEEPCFCVSCLQPKVERFRGERWRAQLPVTVHYFPGSKERRMELGRIFAELMTALEQIECAGEALRGSNMTASEQDGVGVVCVDYDFFMELREEKADDCAMMQLFTLTY